LIRAICEFLSHLQVTHDIESIPHTPQASTAFSGRNFRQSRWRCPFSPQFLNPLRTLIGLSGTMVLCCISGTLSVGPSWFGYVCAPSGRRAYFVHLAPRLLIISKCTTSWERIHVQVLGPWCIPHVEWVNRWRNSSTVSPLFIPNDYRIRLSPITCLAAWRFRFKFLPGKCV